MKFETTQNKNPHRLTIKQHVFPRQSIDRFSDARGMVEVFSSRFSRVVEVSPNNDLFCAKRLWDQITEASIGKTIEDRFQDVARSVISGRTKSIGLLEKRVVDEFFSLWRARHSFLVSGLPDQVCKAIKGDAFTQDQEERLEKKHAIFVREGGVMPGRFAARIHVFGYQKAFIKANANVHWGVVRAGSGEFIAPDCFQNTLVIPVSPVICLMAGQPDSTLSLAEVATTNRAAISNSTHYYFARDLSDCPICDMAPPEAKSRFSWRSLV